MESYEPMSQAVLETLADDELIASWRTFGEMARQYRDLAAKAEWLLRKRLEERQATRIGDAVEVVLRPGTLSHAYLLDVLVQLKEVIGLETWEKVLRPHTEYSVDKKELDRLAQKGGEAAAIIAAGIVSKRGDGRLEVVGS